MACIFKAASSDAVLIYFIYYLCLEEETLCQDGSPFAGIESIVRLSEDDCLEDFSWMIGERIAGYSEADKAFYLLECTLPDGEHCDYIDGVNRVKQFCDWLKAADSKGRQERLHAMVAQAKELKFIQNSQL